MANKVPLFPIIHWCLAFTFLKRPPWGHHCWKKKPERMNFRQKEARPRPHQPSTNQSGVDVPSLKLTVRP